MLANFKALMKYAWGKWQNPQNIFRLTSLSFQNQPRTNLTRAMGYFDHSETLGRNIARFSYDGVVSVSDEYGPYYSYDKGLKWNK